MTYPRDLLEQAAVLAKKEPTRPKQASLRRAISTAYYALFHLIVEDAATALSPPAPAGLRKVVRRAFQHSSMLSACRDFMQANKAVGRMQRSQLPPAVEALLTFPLEPGLIEVLAAFVDLQESRHEADYDSTETWDRREVLKQINIAENAFTAWSTVRKTPNAAVFMTSLLLRKDWGR